MSVEVIITNHCFRSDTVKCLQSIQVNDYQNVSTVYYRMNRLMFYCKKKKCNHPQDLFYLSKILSHKHHIHTAKPKLGYDQEDVDDHPEEKKY